MKWIFWSHPPVVVLLALFCWSETARGGEPIVEIQVGSVLASNQVKRIDQRLQGQGMQARLTRLFQYTSYELMSLETQKVDMRRPTSFFLPGNMELRVRPEQILRLERVALQVELRHADKRLMESVVTLGQQGRVVLGGQSHKGGVLLVWVGARSRETGYPSETPPAMPGEVLPGKRQLPIDNALRPATAVVK